MGMIPANARADGHDTFLDGLVPDFQEIASELWPFTRKSTSLCASDTPPGSSADSHLYL
jgi:hypothetical protein